MSVKYTSIIEHTNVCQIYYRTHESIMSLISCRICRQSVPKVRILLYERMSHLQ